jgi:Na+/melibiose symporter-like transporter
MFYFYTNVLDFKPEFIGELRLMYSVSSIFAVILFNNYLKNIRFTKVFAYSTVFYCCVSWLTILLVERVNVRWGIPDKVFCMGDGVLD